MKPFNLELAKAGHPVCTREGKDVRIICFDKKSSDFPIVALMLDDNDKEQLMTFNLDGTYFEEGESDFDLFMKPVKKEGWINLYKDGFETWTGSDIFSTKENAIEFSDGEYSCFSKEKYLDTIKIEWDEQ